ncbi:MAG: outer membrane lipoprotein carrier protein LolA, partial [Flavobacteriaceae bacterium]|nr:outer membrane lipoprotein carrier protein LolA [Flavobacteriaceae bacterium]
IPENEEVNISNSDIDDQSTVTPSKFFSFYKSGYTYDLGALKSLNGKEIQFVELVPIDTNSEVSSVLVGVDLKNNHIYQIIEIGKNGTDTILTAKTLKTNQNIDGSLFSFDENKYESLGYMINK